MILHTALNGRNATTGKPNYVNVRGTPSDHFVRKSVKQPRINFPVQFDPELSELENCIRAVHQYCQAGGFTDTTWVYTQETAVMYRFTEVTTNYIIVPKVPKPPAVLTPGMALVKPAAPKLDIA